MMGKQRNKTLEHHYPIRYLVEDWNKPPELKRSLQVIPGIALNAGSDYGYADDLLVVSFLRNDAGKISSVVIFDKGNAPMIRCEVLEATRDYIHHILENHKEMIRG